MTQEDKELLLKDLCARLPYDVKVSISGMEFDNYQYHYTLTAISKFGQDSLCKVYSPIYTPLDAPDIEFVKPYLRPMSSMTEEEKFTLSLCNAFIESRSIELKIDFYNQQHIDYRGLIEKGLALEAPKGMYCTK